MTKNTCILIIKIFPCGMGISSAEEVKIYQDSSFSPEHWQIIWLHIRPQCGWKLEIYYYYPLQTTPSVVSFADGTNLNVFINYGRFHHKLKPPLPHHSSTASSITSDRPLCSYHKFLFSISTIVNWHRICLHSVLRQLFVPAMPGTTTTARPQHSHTPPLSRWVKGRETKTGSATLVPRIILLI